MISPEEQRIFFGSNQNREELPPQVRPRHVKHGQSQGGLTTVGIQGRALCHLRSAFALWGRHDLTPKEQRQVRTANVLFVYVIVVATLSSVYGIAKWTEHPDLITRHVWFSARSIWLTEQTRRLQVLPNVHSHKLQHCIYGGKTESQPD